MKKGFSLLEMIVVITIFIILVVIAVAFSINIADTSKTNSVTGVTDFIALQMQKRYMIEGSIPSSQTDFENFLKDSRYFEKVPQNSMWYGDPSKGWTWDSSTNTLAAKGYNGATIYSRVVNFSTENTGSIFVRPSVYGGDR